MKILVCVKQVPDSESVLVIDEKTGWISPEGIVFRMNRYDEYAVEEALRIREAFPGTIIDAITVGPGRAEAVTRRAMEMGADGGIHIALPDERYRTPFETASLIAAYSRGREYDLVLAGIMSEDNMQSQTGPMIAALCALPFVTSVMRAAVSPGASHVEVEREVEGGSREIFRVSLPALLAVQSGINRPRYPSLSNVLRAKGQALAVLKESDLEPARPREEALSIAPPGKRKETVFIHGSSADKARSLLAVLHEKSFL